MSKTMSGRLVRSQVALKEADAGDFASDKDATNLAKKWQVNAGWVAAQGAAKP